MGGFATSPPRERVTDGWLGDPRVCLRGGDFEHTIKHEEVLSGGRHACVHEVRDVRRREVKLNRARASPLLWGTVIRESRRDIFADGSDEHATFVLSEQRVLD